MKVIVIIADCTDELIAVAKDMKSAIKYLIKNEWIKKDDTYFVNYHWVSVIEKFGENWKDNISNISIDEFNKFFRHLIYLEEKEVYEWSNKNE